MSGQRNTGLSEKVEMLLNAGLNAPPTVQKEIIRTLASLIYNEKEAMEAITKIALSASSIDVKMEAIDTLASYGLEALPYIVKITKTGPDSLYGYGAEAIEDIRKRHVKWKRCPNCGALMPLNARFCGMCGRRFPDTEDTGR